MIARVRTQGQRVHNPASYIIVSVQGNIDRGGTDRIWQAGSTSICALPIVFCDREQPGAATCCTTNELEYF